MIILLSLFLINYCLLRFKHKSLIKEDDLTNFLFSPITIWYNLYKRLTYKHPFKRTLNNFQQMDIHISLYDCVDHQKVICDELRKWLISFAKLDSADVAIKVEIQP